MIISCATYIVLLQIYSMWAPTCVLPLQVRRTANDKRHNTIPIVIPVRGGLCQTRQAASDVATLSLESKRVYKYVWFVTVRPSAYVCVLDVAKLRTAGGGKHRSD
jgi:hypothetical protein